MSRWNSIDEIRDQFGCCDPDDNHVLLKQKIKAKMFELHPDKNNGEFETNEHRREYLECADALEFIDNASASTNKTVVLSQNSELIAIVKDLVRSSNSASQAAKLDSISTSLRSTVRSSFTFPKIGSGTFAAVAAFLVAFPDQFKENPILGSLISSSSGQSIILALLAYSSIAFVMSWIFERKLEKQMEFLTSEAFGRSLVPSIYHLRNDKDELQESAIRALIDEEMRGIVRFQLSRILGAGLSISDHEKIASLQIERLIDNNVIELIERKGFDARYKFKAGSESNGYTKNPYDFPY